MKNLFIFVTIHLILHNVFANDVGYNVSQIQNYQMLRRSAKSTLYKIQADGIQDQRPIKLIQLIGSHYQIGYDYGRLLGNEILFTYNKFMGGEIPKRWQLLVLQLFLDWQYQQYVVKQLPIEFLDQIKGIQKGGKSIKIKNLQALVKRVLVVSSYPGNIQYNILYALVDQFKRFIVPNFLGKTLKDILQANMNQFIQFTQQFIKQKKIHCSFFAVWGSRTENGKLYTMRNLDWQSNTGINANKLITVYKIDNKIPHVTLGFPGVIGALTGMSAAGLTVHQAGLDTKKQSQVGFQWTLRLRYVLMNAHNISEVQSIWRNTNNTLGMNHMIASASDLKYGHPALVLQTMAGYTAYFRDHDTREDNTTFYDPKTQKNYTAGFSMPQVVFRTNHGYDPKILKNLLHPNEPQNSDSMIRYRILKNGFNWYKYQNKPISQVQALNMTAILGDKGSEQFMVCPKQHIGINVISVMYSPNDLKMWTAFQYGKDDTFRSACCGVYVEIDMRSWFGLPETYIIE